MAGSVTAFGCRIQNHFSKNRSYIALCELTESDNECAKQWEGTVTVTKRGRTTRTNSRVDRTRPELIGP